MDIKYCKVCTLNGSKIKLDTFCMIRYWIQVAEIIYPKVCIEQFEDQALSEGMELVSSYLKGS